MVGIVDFNLIIENNGNTAQTVRVVGLGDGRGTFHTIPAGDEVAIKKVFGSQYSQVKLSVYVGDLKVIDTWITRRAVTPTTTMPTTTTTAAPSPWPSLFSSESRRLEGMLNDTQRQFRLAVATGHRKPAAARAKQTADRAVVLATRLVADYANYEDGAARYTDRLAGQKRLAIQWQTDTARLVEWQTTAQAADTPEKQASKTWTLNVFQPLPTEWKQVADNILGATNATAGLSDDAERGVRRYIYFHGLRLLEAIDVLVVSLPLQSDRLAVEGTKWHLHSLVQGSLNWLLTDNGFSLVAGRWTRTS